MADGTLIFDTKIDEKGFKDNTGKLAGLAQQGLGVLTGGLMHDALNKIADIGKNAIQTGMSFETASSQIAATMGTTVEALTSDMDQYFGKATINGEEFYGSLIDLAAELGAKTKFTATEAAEGLNILAQSGLNAQDQMAAMPTVLNLAAAGGMDLANSASYVTGAVKGFGGSMDEAQKYADLMAKGATLANTDVQGLGEALSGAAATAKSYGQDADSVTLSLLRLAEQNVTGSVATTALNRAMADLYTPTSDAKEALDALGLSAYDASGEARDFNDVVDDLDKALDGYTDEQKNAYKNTIFTAQGLQAFNKMSTTSKKKVDEFKKGLKGASDGMGAAAEQAQTMSDNLEGDLTIMGSAMDGFYNAVYSKMQAPLRDLVQFGTSAISKLTDGIKTGGVQGMAKAGYEIVNGLVISFKNAVPNVLSTGKDLISNFVDGIRWDDGGMEMSASEIVGRFLGNLATKGLDLVLSGYEWVTNIASGILGNLPGIIDAAGDLLAGFVDSFLQPDNIGSLIDKGAEIVTTLKDAIVENVPKIAVAAWKLIFKVGSAIKDNLPYLITKGKEIVNSEIKGIKDKFPDVVEKGKEIVGQITDGIGELFDSLISKGKEVVDKVIDGIEAKYDELKAKGKATVEYVIGGITSKFTELYNKGAEIVEKVKSGITDFMDSLFGAGSSAAGEAKSGFSSIEFTSVGSNMVSKVKAGISEAAQSLYDTALSVAQKAYNAMVETFQGGVIVPDAFSVGSAPQIAMPSQNLKSSTSSVTNGSSMTSGNYSTRSKTNSIDYSAMGSSVANALNGASVNMDGRKVGNLVTGSVSNGLAKNASNASRGIS